MPIEFNNLVFSLLALDSDVSLNHVLLNYESPEFTHEMTFNPGTRLK